MSNNDDVKRQQELSNAKSLKREYESQLSTYQKRYQRNHDNLERIRQVKSKISQIKQSLEERALLQERHAEKEDTYYEWTGDKQKSVHGMYSQTTPEEYKYYISMVDNLLDNLVDLETEYENDNLEMLGLMGKIGTWINSLASKIEKLLN